MDLYQAWSIAPTAEGTPENHPPLFDASGNRRDPWTNPNALGRENPSRLGYSYMYWAIEFTKSDYFSKLK